MEELLAVLPDEGENRVSAVRRLEEPGIVPEGRLNLAQDVRREPRTHALC